MPSLDHHAFLRLPAPEGGAFHRRTTLGRTAFPGLSLVFLTMALLAAGCGEAGRGGSRDEAEGPLPAPQPGAIEEARSQVDPMAHPDSAWPGDTTRLPEDTIFTATTVVGRPDSTLGADSAWRGAEEGSAGFGGSEGVAPPGAAEPGAQGVRFPRPDHIRGIYLNAWTAGSATRRGRLIELARRTELNTFVIDIKDASGYVSHDSQVPLTREVGATGERRIRDLDGLLNELAAAGIYPIARIVVAKDPILTAGRPDLAIQDSSGVPWLDQHDVMWLNFFHPEVWQYHVDLAHEVAEAGFPEIQWDYVRFPDAPAEYLSRAVFPERDGRSKIEAVRGFLGYSRKILGASGVRVTADVFGVTTSYRRDVGIGQLWESFIDQVDVALPMVYPSHYWTGSFGFEEPNAYPYEIVRRALGDAVRRSAQVEGAGATRPWLQDFSLGDPPYGAPEVRAQIQAAYDVGIQEWILWNPGSRYTESALIPARGLPPWLEPVMRVGGEVVALSKRFEVLGEVQPDGAEAAGSNPVLEDPELLELQTLPGSRELPAVPIPDTGRVVRRK